jgi:aspartyl-tRNA(Asn)/glutamyl-tRNA(Gln) amidotransferase subunit A
MTASFAKQHHLQFTSGERSAQEIARTTLEKIAQKDSSIGAFLSLSADRLLARAQALDGRRARGESTGRLAGIPIAIKDNIHVRGEITTCGSKFLTNYRAPFDAAVVELMEREGALVVGKTNMDEFAMGSSTENSALQRTRNPWNLACVPGGSSGGSAAAVAARMVPFALGSDTGGSVRQPAAFCGIVGFKPTYGRVSRWGLVAFGSSLDQIGPLATSVADAALLMEVLGHHCPRDSTSLATAPESYSSHLSGDIRRLKIGVPWHFLQPLNGPVRRNFEEAVAKLQELGAEIVEINLDALQYGIAAYYILATAEASTNLARFDGIRYGQRSARAQTLDEVYEYSKEEGFGEEVKRRILLGTYVLSAGLQQYYYGKAQKARGVVVQQYRRAFLQVDVVAMPSAPTAAFEIGSIQDPITLYLEDIYTVSANLAGLPAISVPSGFDAEGKPLGLQILGPQGADGLVLRVADAYEKETRFTERLPEIAR